MDNIPKSKDSQKNIKYKTQFLTNAHSMKQCEQNTLLISLLYISKYQEHKYHQDLWFLGLVKF